MRKAAAYCRISTDEQAEGNKFGIEFQKSQIEEYARVNNLEISNWYMDEGVSDASTSHPAFDKLLVSEVTNPLVEVVVVATPDRVAKDINVYYYFKNELNKMDIELISVAEDWSAQDKRIAMVLEDFLVTAGSLQRESLKRRTSGGRLSKAAKGGYSGGRAPMGYKVSNGNLVINKDEAEIVRYIYNKRANGLTFQEIANSVNEAGYRTRKGRKFIFSTIQSILNNRKTYEGWYKYGKNGEWVQGQHEPLFGENEYLYEQKLKES